MKLLFKIITIVGFFGLPQVLAEHNEVAHLSCHHHSSIADNTSSNNNESVINEWNVHPVQVRRLHRLMQVFAQDNNLSPLDKDVKQEVVKAFKVCNITEPVIVLQNHYDTDSSCRPLLDEEYYPVKAMMLGVADKHGKKPLPLIRSALYHECGHIVNGDLEQLPKIKEAIPALGSIVSSAIVTGFKTFSFLANKSLPVRIATTLVASNAALVSTAMLYKKTIGSFFSRQKETKADLFGITTLIKLKDFEALVYGFINLTYNIDDGYSNVDNEFSFLHTHPIHYQRAQMIIDEMQKANIDLQTLPIEENLKNAFITQVKKHFPHHL